MISFLIQGTIVIAGILFNIYWIKNPLVGVIFTVWYFGLFGYTCGILVFPKERNIWKIFLGHIVFCALIIVFGSALYHGWQFNRTGVSALLIFVPFFVLLIFSLAKNNQTIGSPRWIFPSFFTKREFLLALLFLFLESYLLYILYQSRSDLPIRSPWWPGIVPKEFFVIYFFSTFLLGFITYTSRRKTATLWLVIIHFFLSSSVALFVYKNGYGFDPFIHRASENLIAEQGVIFPKTIYYSGQYILVVTLTKMTSLPLFWVDALLIPLLFSLWIPPLIFFLAKKFFANQKYNVFLALCFLALPYSTYIVTTPQALANIFTLVLVSFSSIYLFGNKEKLLLIVSPIMVSASLLIHPLAGLPALILLLFMISANLTQKKLSWIPTLKKILFFYLVTVASLSIPLIFLVQGALSKSFSVTLAFPFVKNAKTFLEKISFLVPYFKNNFQLIYDIVYHYERNIVLVVILFSLVGFFFFRKKIRLGWVLLVTFLVLLVNYLLLSQFLIFSFLPENEQANYPARLLEVSILMLLPFGLLLLHKLLALASQHGFLTAFSVILFFTASLTGTVYTSYPRDDNYRVDRGYNVTKDDIETVRRIHELGKNEEYIVLASPVISAAAIQEFGFLKYYPEAGNPSRLHFYYSVPAGSPLAQWYMEMVSGDTNRKTMQRAMDFVGVSKAFFVVNKYWWNSEIIVEKAKQEARAWWSVNNGQVYIFEFTR